MDKEEEIIEKFMEKVNQEYQEYIGRVEQLPPKDIIEKAHEIAGMEEVYTYLTNGSVEENDINYLLKVKNPVFTIYGIHESFGLRDNGENPVSLTIYDIIDKDMFNDPDINPAVSDERIDKVVFYRKHIGKEYIKSDDSWMTKEKFKIEQIVILSPAEYDYFSNHFLEKLPYVEEYKNIMRYDTDGKHHCVLVTSTNSIEAIIVNSEGYSYARYTAYVPDRTKLDLKDIPAKSYETDQPRFDAHRATKER